MRIVYQIEDIEKKCFDYGRKLHPLSLLKRGNDQYRSIQKIGLSSGLKIELIRHNIDMDGG